MRSKTCVGRARVDSGEKKSEIKHKKVLLKAIVIISRYKKQIQRGFAKESTDKMGEGNNLNKYLQNKIF